jgi:transposase-like protein
MVYMARLELSQSKLRLRQSRYFSEDFRRNKVGELEKNITSVSEISRVYEISRTTVYRWIYKYSLMRKKGIRMVVEAKSDTAKMQALKQHIAELEQLLGQKQFEIDFLKKQMQIASEQYGVDLKKKHSGKHLPGTGKTGKTTTTE